MTTPGNGKTPLAVGAIAALLASACCLGPLMLVTIGISGAWIANLTALEPYRFWFIGAALLAMLLAWRRIFRPAGSCEPEQICVAPTVRNGYRILFWVVAALIIVALVFPYLLPVFY